MSKTSSRVTAIGFFVVTGTALLVAMLIAFGGNSWFRSSATYTMSFNCSVKGLSNGSPVMFRGVSIGQVTNIRLQSPDGTTEGFSAETDNSSTIHFPVLVTVELNPEKLGFPAYSWWAILSGKALTHSRREELEAYLADMVLDQGLRAKLQTLSLLTGQLSIELVFDPLADELDNMNNIRAQLRDGFFPTRLNFLDAVSNRIGEKHFRNQMESIQKIIAQITDFIDSGKSKQLLDDISVIAGNLRTTTDTLNQKFPPLLDDAQSTVADAKSLVGHANEQLAPLVSNTNQLMKRIGLVSEAARLLLNNLNEITTNSQPQVESILAKVNTSLDEAQLTLEDTRSSLKDARSVIAPNSPTRLQLEKTLDNCQDTLDSLRTLIENLNRNPQILLMGE